MKKRSFTALLMVLLLVGVTLPQSSHAFGKKKCERLRKRLEAHCNCTTVAKSSGKNDKESRIKTKKQRYGRPRNGLTSTRTGNGYEYTWLDLDCEDGPCDSVFMHLTVTESGDSLFVQLTPTGDTLDTWTTSREPTREPPQIDTPAQGGFTESENDSTEKSFRKERSWSRGSTDTVEVGHCTVPVGTYTRTTKEPFIQMIFESFPGITKVEILWIKTDDPNYPIHSIVVTGEWNEELYKKLLKWSHIVRKRGPG